MKRHPVAEHQAAETAQAGNRAVPSRQQQEPQHVPNRHLSFGQRCPVGFVDVHAAAGSVAAGDRQFGAAKLPGRDACSIAKENHPRRHVREPFRHRRASSRRSCTTSFSVWNLTC